MSCVLLMKLIRPNGIISVITVSVLNSDQGSGSAEL